MEKKVKPKNDQSDRHIPELGQRSYALTVWLGALTRWVISLGTKKFDDLYQPKSNTKNLIIGYIVILLFVTILIMIMIYAG